MPVTGSSLYQGQKLIKYINTLIAFLGDRKQINDFFFIKKDCFWKRASDKKGVLEIKEAMAGEDVTAFKDKA